MNNIDDVLKKRFDSLISLQKYFRGDDNICREFLCEYRWDNNPTCPNCLSQEYYECDNYRYCCKICRKGYSVTVGTFLEGSKIPLYKWFCAIYTMSSHTKGASSVEISKDYEITQKAAWFMMHRIREMLVDKDTTMFDGITSMDETYIKNGCKEIFVSDDDKGTQGRSLKTKTGVFAAADMVTKKIKVMPVSDTRRRTLRPIIERWVAAGSMIVTDEYSTYEYLSKDNSVYHHATVNHKHKEYVRGAFHTNAVESFWGFLKNGIYSTYHLVSKKHLSRYCDEFAFRWNSLKKKGGERVNVALKSICGRLKYQDLIQPWYIDEHGVDYRAADSLSRGYLVDSGVL